MNISPIFVLGSVLFALLTGFGVGFPIATLRKLKGPEKTGDVVVGIRATSRNARLREGVSFVRGMYTWKEKVKGGEDFEADIHSHEDFGLPLGDGRTLWLVDLDSWHVVTPMPAVGEPDPGAVLGIRPNETANVTGPRKVVALTRYGGQCMNDGEETEIADATGNVQGTVQQLWRRMPGTRLNQIRKRENIRQLNATMQGWWMMLTRFMPVMVIFSVVLLVVILGIMIKVML